MSELLSSGQWPNVAVDPRTGRHAATGEEIERDGQMTNNELLPCPFCGGEADMQVSKRWPDGAEQAVNGYTVVCQSLDCILGGDDEWWCDTEAEAIAAWNTRAERTCRVKASYYTADVDNRGSNAEWYFAFSCGHELYWDDGEPPKYCPECGWKVVGE